MKILLITSSARGHAIAEALSKSTHKPDIIALSPSRNPGIRTLAAEQHVVDIMNFDAVSEIAKAAQPDFAFIGPDDPIGAGLADALLELGIESVAPKKALAQIEASKGFTRGLLSKHGIDASPRYRVYTEKDIDAKRHFIEELGGEFVVKYDALKGGKGVKVSGEHLSGIDEGIQYALECIEECGRVVIEEKLIGCEFSLLSFVSGTSVIHMPAVQDHKRAYIGDTGPNTGGMGTYSDADHSLPFLRPEDILQAHDYNERTADALLEECGQGYRGILYGGFIATAKGVKLIEYNARFGDPEALNILPLLQTDFVDICQAMISGDLIQDMVQFEKKATVCSYITPESYPTSKDQKGEPVSFPDIPENARLYFGDIAEADNGSLQLGGSRTAGIVGIGDTIEEAHQIAVSLCEKVEGRVRYRPDIGSADLVGERVAMMKELRN